MGFVVWQGLFVMQQYCAPDDAWSIPAPRSFESMFSPLMPQALDYTPLHLPTQPCWPSVVTHPIPPAVGQELRRLHEETAQLRSRNKKLEDTLTSSGLVAGGKDSVITQRGRPATKRIKKLVKRIVRAEAALECTC